MPSGTAITCPQCGQEAFKATGSVNRSRSKGAPVFCGRVCAGLYRRRPALPLAQRQAEKAEYDRRRREVLGDALLERKRLAYHAAVAADTVGQREKEREQRQRRMPSHLAYCRTPEYREWKRAYDRRYLATQHYGPFADAALVLRDLEEEINDRSTWLERQIAKGTLNKPAQRKRDYGKRSIGETVRSQPERGAVGDAEINPKRPASAGGR